MWYLSLQRSVCITRLTCVCRRNLPLIRFKSGTQVAGAESDEEDEKPLKYTETDAHRKWKAAYSFRGPDEDDNTPRYEAHVVKGSIVALLVYMCFLREESDIDQEFTKPLFERLPHLEKPMIVNSIEANKKLGNDVTELERRLRELEAKEAAEGANPNKS